MRVNNLILESPVSVRWLGLKFVTPEPVLKFDLACRVACGRA